MTMTWNLEPVADSVLSHGLVLAPAQDDLGEVL